MEVIFIQYQNGNVEVTDMVRKIIYKQHPSIVNYIQEIDEIAKINRKGFNEDVENQLRYTRPWLEIDPEIINEYINGKLSILPYPYEYIYPAIILQNVDNKRVLCLASGGGQQSAIFGILQAKVSVIDISEKQLIGDQIAAEHYGYEVSTFQGDMRDLSIFPENSFDIIYQAISMIYVPNVREVYREVFRILKPNGLYRVGHLNPATYPVHFTGERNGWDGIGYRITEPYRGGAIKKRDDGTETMTEGEITGEFRHLFSDIFNGLLEVGFTILGVWEAARHLFHNNQADPGSEEHKRNVIGDRFCILVRK